MKSRDLEHHIKTAIRNLKNNLPEPRAHGLIPVFDNEHLLANLRVITVADLRNDTLIKDLARWRQKYSIWYPSQFKVTFEGTKRWLQKDVLENEGRILFLLESINSKRIGHMGFYRFDFSNRTCEADNILRGSATHPGIMTSALKRLMMWGIDTLYLSSYTLRTFSDNKKAIALYKRCGFRSIGELPLVKKVNGDRTDWVPADKDERPQRFFLKMRWSMDFWSKKI